MRKYFGIQSSHFTKNPYIAGFLSFLLIGLGQIYNGDISKGIKLFIVGIVITLLANTLFLGFTLLRTIPLLLLRLVSMVDAYNTAKKINNDVYDERFIL